VDGIHLVSCGIFLDISDIDALDYRVCEVCPSSDRSSENEPCVWGRPNHDKYPNNILVRSSETRNNESGPPTSVCLVVDEA